MEEIDSNLQLLHVKTFVYLAGVVTSKPVYFMQVIVHLTADCICTKQTVLEH